MRCAQAFSMSTYKVQDFREYLSYGATGVVAFVLVKWVLPVFNTVIKKAQVENAIYGNAKDLIDYTNEQLKTMQSRYDVLHARFVQLELELEKERERCRRLQSQLEEYVKNADDEN